MGNFNLEPILVFESAAAGLISDMMVPIVMLLLLAAVAERKSKKRYVAVSLLAAYAITMYGSKINEYTIPPVVWNLAAFICIQIHYRGTFLLKVLQVIYYVLFTMIAEVAAFTLFPQDWILISTNIILVIISQVIKFVNKRNKRNVPSYVMTILLLLLAGNYTLLVITAKLLLGIRGLGILISLQMGAIMLLIVYLFDKLAGLSAGRQERLVYEQESREIGESIKTRTAYLEERRRLLHDWKHHLGVLNDMFHQDKIVEASAYIEELDKSFLEGDEGEQNGHNDC